MNSSSKKTREKIKKAFAILIKEKQYLEKITVTDLTRKADITRSAFYTHYDNIYEVAQEIQNETFDVLRTNMSILKSTDDINACLDEIFKYLKENENFYSLIFSSDVPLLFSSKLNKMINQYLCDMLSMKNIKDLELKITFFIDGCMALVIKHFRQELNCSLDEINAYMKDAFKSLFSK